MTELLDHGDRLEDGDGEVAASRWPVPAHEDRRVAALRGYGVLDQPQAQPDLDAAVRLAAYVCGVPTAAINLIDADRQWQAAAFGAAPAEAPREAALCAWAVTGTDVVHVDDASQDPRFATSAYVTGPLGAVRSYAAAPLVTRDGFAIGTICAYDQQVRSLSEQQLSLLRDIADQVMCLFELRRTATALARVASRDVLTGLANRRATEQAVASAIARAERGLGTPAVVMVDLDDFKQINDAHGHAAGDAVLCAVADRLRGTARVVDTVGRLGGDEFVLLLEHTGGTGATAAVSRLRAALAAIGQDGSGGRPVGASLGLATYRPGDSVATMLARADAEMYADKQRG
ncbi:MAG: diguanylate cyclase domain-containing protein [Actinomycetes bacterium]